MKAGEKIELLEWPASAPLKLLPDSSIRLKILHQDPQLVAVDKAAGFPSHPLKATEIGTVANALVAKFPRAAKFKNKPLEAGLIHRLDNETSGVLLFALQEAGLKRWQVLNQQGGITKFYLALVAGKPAAKGRVTLAIAHHPKNKKKMVVARSQEEIRQWKARPAVTEYRRVKFSSEASLVLLRIHRGSRHQIRVHLAAIGHPILGDAIYGKGQVGPRHFLHARKVEFKHSFTGKKISILAPLPSDFRKKMLDVL